MLAKSRFSLLLRTFFSSQKSHYQDHPNLSTTSSTFKASDLQIKLLPTLPPLPQFSSSSLQFGAYPADHMLTIDWCASNGWQRPLISPLQPVEMHRFNSTLHYAIQCYEGMKAYKNSNDEIRLFRPECNMYRFKETSKALCLPDFDGGELLRCIERLVKVDKRWIPTERGFSLYIRPAHISMEETLGVKEASRSQIFVVLNPVGPYYPEGFKPISLYCETEKIRSAPLGSGNFKMGCNYGPTISSSLKAKKKGYTQVLWLFQGRIGEVGTSNFFYVVRGDDGVLQLHTPQLDGLILPGVTRDTIIRYVSKMKGYRVVERKIVIDDLIKAIKDKKIVEAFGSGTAVIVSPINAIGYKDQKYDIPIDKQLGAGRLASTLFNDFLNIQEGKVKHPWSHKIL